MTDIIFCLFYLLLFSIIILQGKWFNAGGFSNKHFLGFFYIKLLFGVALWYIYTHIYKNRLTSDVFKYYDDARIIFDTLHSSVKDYLTLLTGIGDTHVRYQDVYHSMNNWENGYGTVLYSNSHFIIRMNAFFWLFSQGHYGVHVIFMCFISLVGLLYVYKAFLPFLKDRSRALFFAVFLFPSVILWSSGVLKEGFVWLGLGLSIYYFFRLTDRIGNSQKGKISSLISHLLYLVIGSAILFESKAYVLLCIIPAFVALFLVKKSSYCSTYPLMTYGVVLFVYLSSSFLPHVFFKKISPLKMLSDKQTDFNRISRGGIYLGEIKDTEEYISVPITDSANIVPLNSFADSLVYKRGIQYLTGNSFWYNELKTGKYAPFMLRHGSAYNSFRLGKKDTIHTKATDSTAYCICVYIEPAKSSIYIDPIKPTLKSLLNNILQAFKVSMLLPYPWKIHSAMTGIYCAENIFVLIIIFIALFFLKCPFPHKEIILFCLTYFLMMLILIGMTTPILGGIERYKSVVIPFMFILLLLIIEKPIAKS